MGKPKLLRRTSSLVQDAAESTKKVLMSHFKAILRSSWDIPRSNEPENIKFMWKFNIRHVRWLFKKFKQIKKFKPCLTAKFNRVYNRKYLTAPCGLQVYTVSECIDLLYIWWNPDRMTRNIWLTWFKSIKMNGLNELSTSLLNPQRSWLMICHEISSIYENHAESWKCLF